MVVETPQARPPSRLGLPSTAPPADARSDIGPGPASGADVVSGPRLRLVQHLPRHGVLRPQPGQSSLVGVVGHVGPAMGSRAARVTKAP
jgi:hypothetical protein